MTDCGVYKTEQRFKIKFFWQIIFLWHSNLYKIVLVNFNRFFCVWIFGENFDKQKLLVHYYLLTDCWSTCIYMTRCRRSKCQPELVLGLVNPGWSYRCLCSYCFLASFVQKFQIEYWLWLVINTKETFIFIVCLFVCFSL